MFYYNYKPDEHDYNECISKGVCSISPTISALQSVIFMMLCELAYYITKLEMLGAKNEKIKQGIVSDIICLNSLHEYTENQILQIINKLFSNLSNTKDTYMSLCDTKSIKVAKYQSPVILENNMEFNKLINMGEKAFEYKYKNFDNSIKEYAEILFTILKPLAILIIEMQDFQVLTDRPLNAVIKALNIYNRRNINEIKIREVIRKLSDLNAELMLELNKIKTEKFGAIKPVEVSNSTRSGKAVMVSGSNLTELEEVLKNVKNTAIDVYTNGNLLIAHAYSKFQTYENLRGHFGNGVETSPLDFATFPGAILLTKNETHNIEYLYRGRIFTTEEIPPKGVAQPACCNLVSLIESAENAKGFTKGQIRDSVNVGFDIAKVLEKFDDIAQKLENETYKYLFIIGLSNHTNIQDKYFKSFFKNKSEDSFVISFSYAVNDKKVFTINVANDYSLVTGLLFKLFERIPIDSEKIVFFLTKCDAESFAGMVRLNKRGAKNIFMSGCLPSVMNPTAVKAFKNFYNINTITTVQNDLEKIINKTI